MAKKPRVKIPGTAKKGDIIQIKTLFPHKMETGRRRDKDGKLIPRKIINRFECSYNGKTVFSTDLHPAVSANPYISFKLMASESGPVEFKWIEDGGKVTTLKKNLTVN
ncbi:MAG: thiosulfate oxidation carrier complex protein SoxZ [Gammaproteobacteria bacterium]